MTESTEALLRGLERNLSIIQRNTEGMTTEQSLIPFMEGASTLNWLLSHLIVYRDTVLRSLGAEPVWDDPAREAYGFGSSASNSNKSLEELLKALETSQERLGAALRAATPEQLGAERPNGNTVAQFIEFQVWHDSYHCGQTTIYRRLAGLESPIG